MRASAIRGSFWALITACTLAFPSCSKNSAPKASKSSSGQVLRIAVEQAPASLDPAAATGNLSCLVINLLYDGLMRTGPDGEPVPALAKEINVSEDYKTYIFTLKDTKWSNGDPVTASHFIYAWKRAILATAGTEYAETLEAIRNTRDIRLGLLPIDEIGLYAPDTHTLVVALEHPAPYFLELTTLPLLKPVHPSSTLFDDPSQLIVNGPFQVHSWNAGERLSFTRNPKHWESEQVSLAQVDIAIEPDTASRQQMFRSQKVDWTGEPSSGVYMFVINTQEAPFSNRHFRKALGLALNRKALLQEMDDNSKRASRRFVPVGMDHASPYTYFNDDDLERARHLFDKAMQELQTTADALEPIVLTTSLDKKDQKIAEQIRKQWNQAFGIIAKVETLDADAYQQRLATRKYQVAHLSSPSLLSDPLVLLQRFEQGNNRRNPTGWEKVEYSQLLKQARHTADLDRRTQLLRQAEAVLIEEMPVIPLFYGTQSFKQSPQLEDVTVSKQGFPDFKWAKFVR